MFFNGPFGDVHVIVICRTCFVLHHGMEDFLDASSHLYMSCSTVGWFVGPSDDRIVCNPFLVATKRLSMMVCLSDGWSVGPSVGWMVRSQLFFSAYLERSMLVHGLVFF